MGEANRSAAPAALDGHEAATGAGANERVVSAAAGPSQAANTGGPPRPALASSSTSQSTNGIPATASLTTPSFALPIKSPNATAFTNTSRKPYIPQFSAATQMILKRMRGEKGGFDSALASATAPGAPRPQFSQSNYDSVREKVIASMADGGGGGGARAQFKTPVSSSSANIQSTSTTLPLPASPNQPRASPAANLTLKAGQKRKLGKDDADSNPSSPTEASDYGEGILNKKRSISRPSNNLATGNTTTTKSGRQILKPDTYDPAAEDNARRRNRIGAPRTTEQALCKRCTRMHSPATNQMVFCDGCNDPWHQRCHEPWIDDEVVQDQNLNWYCATCAAKREKSQPKKKVAKERPRLVSWAGKPSSQKLAYLQKLSQTDLINLLMHATDLQPDLAIFPMDSTKVSPRPSVTGAVGAPSLSTASLYATASSSGLFSRAEANPVGPMNFIRKIPANAKKSTMAKARSGPGSLQSKLQTAAASQKSTGHQLLPPEEDSSFTKLWPRPGNGLYSRLAPDAEDDTQLVDKSDYDAFSVIVYNEKGKKIEENGVKV